MVADSHCRRIRLEGPCLELRYDALMMMITIRICDQCETDLIYAMATCLTDRWDYCTYVDDQTAITMRSTESPNKSRCNALDLASISHSQLLLVNKNINQINTLVMPNTRQQRFGCCSNEGSRSSPPSRS